MCSYTEDYEYTIPGEINLSVFERSAEEVEKLPRRERFKIYGELYHLFLHVSQKINDYIALADINDPKVSELMEEIPNVSSLSKELEDSFKNYTTSEEVKLTDELHDLNSKIKWSESGLKSAQRSLEDTRDTLERYIKSVTKESDHLEELYRMREDLHQQIEDVKERQERGDVQSPEKIEFKDDSDEKNESEEEQSEKEKQEEDGGDKESED